MIRSHHEKLDGSGYPDGLRGDEIPILAQIMTVADIYDALASSRSYKPGLPFEVCSARLAGEVGRGYIGGDLVRYMLEIAEEPMVSPQKVQTILAAARHDST